MNCLLWAWIIWGCLISSSNAQSATCTVDGVLYVKPSFADEAWVCQDSVVYCKNTYNDVSRAGYFGYPTINMNQISSFNRVNCDRYSTKVETLYEFLAPVTGKNKFVYRAPFHKLTAIHFGPRNLVYFRHPDVCSGLGWAFGELQLTGSTRTYGTRVVPEVNLVFPSYFSSGNFRFKWFCQGDPSQYLSVFQMKFAVPWVEPGSTVTVLPELTGALPECPVFCDPALNQRCNTAPVRSCECIPPAVPVPDPTTGLVVCQAVVEVITELPASEYNVNDDGDVRLGVPYNCWAVKGNERYRWCKGVVKNPFSVSELCNYHGRSLLEQVNPLALVPVATQQCWCDLGWSGPKCNFPCYRTRPEDFCSVEPDECGKLGFQSLPGYSSFCVPIDPRIRPMTLRLFTQIGYDATLDNQAVRLIEYEFPVTGITNLATYKLPVCYLNTYSPTGDVKFPLFRTDKTPSPPFETLCRMHRIKPGTNTIEPILKIVKLQVYNINTVTYFVHQLDRFEIEANVYAQPQLNVRKRGGPIYNPVPWSNDPDLSPNFYDQIRSDENYTPIPRVNWIRDEYGTIHSTLVYTVFPAQTAGYRLVNQCSDRSTYPSPADSFICVPCSQPLKPGEYCWINGRATCLPGFERRFGGVGCYPISCRPGFAGERCTIKCPSCPLSGMQCNEGPTGNGRCGCKNALYSYNAQQMKCVPQNCGTIGSKCSNNGECIQTKNYEYCMCDSGFTGAQCQTRRFTALTTPQFKALTATAAVQYERQHTECDCFVRWLAPRSVAIVAPLPKGFEPVVDYTEPYAPMRIPNFVATVGSIDQAKFLCYQDAQCSGFTIYRKPNHWTETLQLNPGMDVFAVVWLQDTKSGNPSSVLPPAGFSTVFYQIDRHTLYNCPGVVLDPVYYRRTYTAEILSFCKAEIDLYNANRGLAPPLSVTLVCYADPMTRKHWRYVGHLQRLSPNPSCVLTPSVYDPKSYCATGRCSSGEGLPCSTNGFCVQQSATEYGCDCKKFNLPNDAGALGLNGRTAFIGNSCQFSVSSNCVARNSRSLCSGNSDSCKPKLAYSGDFFLSEFESQRTDDFIPFCDCSNTPFTGIYCEESRCGPRSGGCKSVSGAGGDCLLQSNGQYKCLCQRGAIGEFCEISASSCVFNDLKCSSSGTCVPADRTSPLPYCVCETGFSGKFCEDSECPIDVMVPGRGICLNRAIERCYPPFTGSRCQTDQCARFGGNVTTNAANIPTSCACNLLNGFDNKLNNVVVASCWPQCPVVNGQMCGVSGTQPHTCLQSESIAGVRTAQCQCAQGYFRVPHPTLKTQFVCEKYCKNGEVPLDWNERSPTPCECSPTTGFDTFNNRPRCDNPICANGGHYIDATQQCDCNRPWNSADRCKSHSCGPNGQPVAWLNSAVATSPFQCGCKLPFAPRLASLPFDCLGTLCGSNGILNPFYNAALNPSLVCVCTGKFKTDCSSPTGCSYCSTTTCLNNGFSLPISKSVCQCLFPYTNGRLGTCDSNVCAASQTISVEPGLCRCAPGFLGQTCESSFCRNGGQFDLLTGFCRCAAGFFGSICDVAYTDVLPFLETLPQPPAPPNPSNPPNPPTSNSSSKNIFRPCAIGAVLAVWAVWILFNV